MRKDQLQREHRPNHWISPLTPSCFFRAQPSEFSFCISIADKIEVVGSNYEIIYVIKVTHISLARLCVFPNHLQQFVNTCWPRIRTSREWIRVQACWPITQDKTQTYGYLGRICNTNNYFCLFVSCNRKDVNQLKTPHHCATILTIAQRGDLANNASMMVLNIPIYHN